MESEVKIPVEDATLDGNLTLPRRDARGMVLFAHGSGSSRFSPRNRFVAQQLNNAGLATLLFDLLTPDEESEDVFTREHRFNITMLAERLVWASDWLTRQPEGRDLRMGYFGSSTGAGAALVAAAERPWLAAAVVSRGGRPDLASDSLPHVIAPTLLIVGGDDDIVIKLNREAMGEMRHGIAQLEIVPGATHLFEEPGTLEQVAQLASAWFVKHLAAETPVES